MITVIISPSANVLLVNVSPFVPALMLLTCHSYDGIVPPLVGVAVNVTVPPRQIEDWLAATVTVGATIAADMVIGVLVAVEVVVQIALLVMITVTISPSANVLLVNVLLFVPTLLPLTCHWYDGVAPPFVGVAVNVTLAPRQIDVWLAAMVTAGVTLIVVIIIELLVDVSGVAHGSLLVMITVI
jgi:hypothetical protein